jgi:hypothetical protein
MKIILIDVKQIGEEAATMREKRKQFEVKE